MWARLSASPPPRPSWASMLGTPPLCGSQLATPASSGGALGLWPALRSREEPPRRSAQLRWLSESATPPLLPMYARATPTLQVGGLLSELAFLPRLVLATEVAATLGDRSRKLGPADRYGRMGAAQWCVPAPSH